MSFLQRLSSGTELIVDYGSSYWEDFAGCERKVCERTASKLQCCFQ